MIQDYFGQQCCYMTKFFKDVQGLQSLMDPTLLNVYDQLPKDKL